MTVTAPAEEIQEAPAAPRHPARFVPWLLAAVFFAGYATLSVLRFRRFEMMSWDLGIFDQVVDSYAHLRAPVADLKGPGFNILGDHFSPVLALLAPFRALFPTPVTLLVAQAALMALSVVPVTRAARRLLGDHAGVAIGIAYGLSWGIQRAVEFDFHEICFAVPLIAFALEALLRERWVAALCWAAPLVTVKEDLGVTASAIALVVLLRTWRGSRRVAVAAVCVGIFGVAMSALTLTVLIPAFNHAGDYAYWDKVDKGGTPGAGGWDVKIRTLFWVMVPTTGLLALRSPLLLVAVPTLAWRLLTQEEHYWGTGWHYSAVLMPIVMLALVDAAARARSGWLRACAGHLPAGALLVALSTTVMLPLPLEQLARPERYERGPVAEAAVRALAKIPDGATVESNIRPIAYLTNRCRVFWVGDTGGHAPQYVALFEPDKQRDAILDDARSRHPGAAYDVEAYERGVWVLRRTFELS
ncbi:DUF2079 domain-containing protein [Actinomadura macrotermitis]|uniref:DUF2079 domain-containing protein n=1 Tax=Actinomadura macrotermitis TaxID=2585200 RepID=A0A7K0BUG4_9ACTN|nr:DUF2079 domain-containing protein [Actinomadura macrotermitis]MQY04791.1 hypothetical protein [Actinomadura macrotermitis]